jgi:hypothetical protein
VKVFGVVTLLVIIAFVVLHVTGGGARGHGMNRHAPAKASPDPSAPSERPQRHAPHDGAAR